MASMMESLVPELFHNILGQLSYAELARLLRCSKYLHYNIEPFLYRSEAAHSEAMRWACKTGNLQTIRLAISYGACVSTIKQPGRPNYSLDSSGNTRMEATDNVKGLTLQLAARKHHVDAFALLLELGAGIGNEESMQRKLMQLLCSRGRETLLRHFLNAGFGPQVIDRPGMYLSVVSIIRSGGSLDTVRILLDEGAQLDRLEPIGEHTLASPLSAAIMENSTSLFDLLIERGANIHGTEEYYTFNKGLRHEYPFSIPLHIPVFAAAQVMAKQGVTMMQRCLDSGADINRRYYAKPWNDRLYLHYYTTPLLHYLDSIDSWKSDTGLRPVDGLAYLFEEEAELETEEDHIDALIRPDERPSSVERLLDKWGLEQLPNPEFFTAVKFLVMTGAMYSAKRILTKYRCWIYPGRLDIITGWQQFVDLILKNRDICDVNSETNDALLRHIILKKATNLGDFGDVERSTINCLLKAGANINDHLGCHGRTALYELCLSHSLEKFQHRYGWYIHSCDYICKRIEFFSFLVEKGAYPSIIADGRLTIDILMGYIDPFWNVKLFLLGIATILWGQKLASREQGPRP
ncbi:uncharacterized protein BP5553_00726 [Venustampulla echinocandica]|uniref:Uncharacterized protein n=1 Tax=Venustampulla echinocandica TaxID=2656787 RepID=A0A370TYZ1_9HELO|nr:uncharacterized protein BP5553_00726 [Venustampulla echinocandica]RDL40747.1 hypothetical protein BP5553_00726 [Venustampulla echinocandica]